MITWSLERLIADAARCAKAVVAPVFAPVFDAIYPPLMHDWDRPCCEVTDGWKHADGCPLQRANLAAAEALAEREAEEEVSEPRANSDDDSEVCYFCGEPTGNIVDTDHGAEYVCERCADTPGSHEPEHPHKAIPDHNGYCKAGISGGELCDLWEGNPIHNVAAPCLSEPSLTDDELVAVRQLIEERFPNFAGAAVPNFAGAAASLATLAPVDPHTNSPLADHQAGNGPAAAAPPDAAAGSLNFWRVCRVLADAKVSLCLDNQDDPLFTKSGGFHVLTPHGQIHPEDVGRLARKICNTHK